VRSTTVLLLSALLVSVSGAGTPDGPSGWDHHTRTYTTAEIEALTPQPKSPLDLLRNIKVAWDRYLLPQDVFWPKATLLRFFAGDSVSWDPEERLGSKHRTDRDLTREDGMMVISSKLTSTPVQVFRSHSTSEEETASWVYHYPRTLQKTGIIEVPFHGSIKWRDVRELFGDGAVGGPPLPPIADTGARIFRVSLLKPTEEPHTDFIFCYRATNQEPSREAAIFIDEICFGVRRTVWVSKDRESRYRPMDEDEVLRVRMKESTGRIPNYCYALELEPSLVDKCPPRRP